MSRLKSIVPTMFAELMEALGGKDAPLSDKPVTISSNLAQGLLMLLTANMEVLAYETPVNPERGFLIPVQEFLKNCKSHAFIDYDGYGYPVKDDLYMTMVIYPSRVDIIPKDATHIFWFNR